MFNLKLVTPNKTIVHDVPADEVFVPAHRGELNILPGHMPLVTTLTPGILKYRLEGQDELKKVAISWGYCEVNPFGVTVLADTAEAKEEIDKARCEQAMKTAQDMLSKDELSTEELEMYQRKLKRAEVRLELVD